jgi:O-antigen ligase
LILVLLLTVAERRVRLSHDLGMAWTLILFGSLLALAVVLTIPRGGPIGVVKGAWHSFNREPVEDGNGDDLTGRLFDAYSNGRKELWTVALDQWRDHPIVGAGAGTFAAEFYADENRVFDTESAHSLYFETLGELGIVGSFLLLLVVLTPIAAGIRARHEPLAVTALGGYVVILVQAAVDTDWESPAVVVPALLLGGTVVAAARGKRLPLGHMGRGGLVGLSAMLALLCGYALSANRAMDQAAAATRSDPCGAIAHAQRAADRMPWSARTWQALAGTYVIAGDLAGARRAYARAVKQAPTDFRLWYASGAVQDPAGAAAVFAEARRLNPHLDPDDAIEPIDPAEFPLVDCS